MRPHPAQYQTHCCGSAGPVRLVSRQSTRRRGQWGQADQRLVHGVLPERVSGQRGPAARTVPPSPTPTTRTGDGDEGQEARGSSIP